MDSSPLIFSNPINLFKNTQKKSFKKAKIISNLIARLEGDPSQSNRQRYIELDLIIAKVRMML